MLPVDGPAPLDDARGHPELVRRTGAARDGALQTVLNGLTGGRAANTDAPDGWITAIRVLPALSAQYAPFPDGIDAALRDMLRARGIDQLYTHQARRLDTFWLTGMSLLPPRPHPARRSVTTSRF